VSDQSNKMSAMNTLTLTQNAGHLKSGWLILMVAVLSWPLASWGTTTTTLSGKVIHIVDGDTFDVLDAAREKHRIRVSCMDTPEKGQAFYRRANDALADLIAGRDVIVPVLQKGSLRSIGRGGRGHRSMSQDDRVRDGMA
jgi:endonuclease YncB( thermonuclease family)